MENNENSKNTSDCYGDHLFQTNFYTGHGFLISDCKHLTGTSYRAYKINELSFAYSFK